MSKDLKIRFFIAAIESIFSVGARGGLCQKHKKSRWMEHTLGKGKVSLQAYWSIRPELIPGFCSMKRLGVFLLPPGWDASPSHRVTPSILLVPIYTLWWREAPRE